MLTPDTRSESSRLFRVYLLEAIASIAANLLTIGIFFYTISHFGFTTRQNLIFSAVLGVAYIFGALSAHLVSHRFGAARALVGIYSATVLLSLAAGMVHDYLPVCGLITVFVYFMTMSWPILEHLVATGNIDGKTLARRITVYNLTWSGFSAITVALGGTIIEHFPLGMFVIPSGCGVVCAAVALLTRLEPRNDRIDDSDLAGAQPEPSLLVQRKLAVRLARISMPAMYVVTYALAALMPTIPVLQTYGTATQTLISSAWYAVRWLAFLLLGLTVFWHTRPRLLLAAGAGLLVSFVVIVLPFTHDHLANMTIMLLGQVLLGFATGLIYMCSLYFGMVLSEGSAASGGYHEALIGVGMMLGPAAGAAMEFVSPHSQLAAVTAVSGILLLSLICAQATSMRLRR